MIGRDPVFALAAAALVALTPAAGADDRRNIIFIMSDDHASAAVGAYGSRINETPRLDRLATEGALWQAGANVAASNVLGVLGVWLGYRLVRGWVGF